MARQTLLDWELAKRQRNSSNNHQQRPSAETWQKPAPNYVKCNVDAIVFLEQLKFGYDMCIRNHLGEFLCAKTMIVEGSILATEAEARGLWEALSWVSNLGYENVIFEVDCKSIVDNIHGDHNCQTEAGVIISTCKETLRQFSNYQGWPSWLVAVAGEAIDDWTPRRANTFEKLAKIGQGTYSNVYKARYLVTGKIVALKKVRFDNLEPESVKFMAREILVLRKLDHPNVGLQHDKVLSSQNLRNLRLWIYLGRVMCFFTLCLQLVRANMFGIGSRCSRYRWMKWEV